MYKGIPRRPSAFFLLFVTLLFFSPCSVSRDSPFFPLSPFYSFISPLLILFLKLWNIVLSLLVLYFCNLCFVSFLQCQPVPFIVIIPLFFIYLFISYISIFSHVYLIFFSYSDILLDSHVCLVIIHCFIPFFRSL